ncbi:hypothetical protein AB6V29_01395 [Microbacterium sp. 20-116]|uniref:hypothetical protein n=1 Tax=Microbacterium sp. 20-116 TaxID=3239883 RepID=UPI0034E279C7
MQPDQIGALLTAAGIVIGSLAALITAIGALIKAARKPGGDEPAPQVGITATVPADDIDIRAWEDLKQRLKDRDDELRAMTADRDKWMLRALGVDEDTHPI